MGKNWFQQRAKFVQTTLSQKFRDREPVDYKIFLRMDGGSFDELLEFVTHHICKKDIVMKCGKAPVQVYQL